MYWTVGYSSFIRRAAINYSARVACRYASSTVFALSSGQGKCGVAIIRVTGEDAKDAILSMCKPSNLPQPRYAALRRIVHHSTRDCLDHGLVLWFPGPQSFTGEDCVEFQTHGGPAVLVAILASLGSLNNFTPAQPGDFTKRAFYNGKLDLTAVEGLGDLIHAETEAQRKQALRQMEGALTIVYSKWRKLVIACRANLEAYIDFSEDDNIEDGVIEDVERNINTLITEMSDHLSDNRRGERLRNGLHLAILGKPNVGKSSFLNTVVRRPAAIVSPVAGTTRDIVETTLDLGGYPVIISDTAGLRYTQDLVEHEGVKRAIARARLADIAIIIVDALELIPRLKEENFNLHIFIKEFCKEVGLRDENTVDNTDLSWFDDCNYILLVNKLDLVDSENDLKLIKTKMDKSSCGMSIISGDGVDVAIDKLKCLCSSLCSLGAGDTPTLTTVRHRTHITNCLNHLKVINGSSKDKQINRRTINDYRITETLSKDDETQSEQLATRTEEQVSESHTEIYMDQADGLLHDEALILFAAMRLQEASRELGNVTGNITTEDVLDHIFSSFCIGK